MFDARGGTCRRTTLTIDDDVLAVAKAMAARQRKPVGAVISALARESLRPAARRSMVCNGVPLLAVKAGHAPVTPDLVAQLMDAST